MSWEHLNSSETQDQRIWRGEVRALHQMHSTDCSTLRLPPCLGNSRHASSPLSRLKFLWLFHKIQSLPVLPLLAHLYFLLPFVQDQQRFFAMIHISWGMRSVQSHSHCFWGDYLTTLFRDPWGSVAKRNGDKSAFFKKYHSLCLWGSGVSEDDMYRHQYNYSTGLVLLIVCL